MKMVEELILERYQILGILSEGGFSKVYKVFDTRMERLAAIKEIPKAPKTTPRALREAKAVALLNHPNIITLYDFEEDENNYYLIMEYVEGSNLSKLLVTKKPLPLTVALAIAFQICSALEYAHTNEIIHRDIKPENLILFKEGRLKVMDFGVARLKSSTLTQEGEVLGTFAYMSPEQTQGKFVDERTDLFALGAVLYQMLTGRSPFETETPAATVFKILRHEPPSLKDLNPEVPPKLEQVIFKSLAKNPDDRFDSVVEFRYKLERAFSLKTGSQKILKDYLKEESLEKIGDQAWALPKFFQMFQEKRAIFERISLSLFVFAGLFPAFKIFSLPFSSLLLLVFLIIMASLLWPALGVASLMAFWLFFFYSTNLPLAISFSFLFGAYFLFFSRKKPFYSLIPLLAIYLNSLKLDLLYPMLTGALFSWPLSLILAGLGSLAISLTKIVFPLLEPSPFSFKSFALMPLKFGSSPFFIFEVFLWATAASGVSLFFKKRKVIWGFLGLAFGTFLLSLGYTTLPSYLGLKAFPLTQVMQELSLSFIILLGFLFLIPFPYSREKTKKGDF